MRLSAFIDHIRDGGVINNISWVRLPYHYQFALALPTILIFHKTLYFYLMLFFLQSIEACNFIKKDTLTQVFSCEFEKFLRAPLLQNTSGRLLLSFHRHLILKTQIHLLSAICFVFFNLLSRKPVLILVLNTMDFDNSLFMKVEWSHFMYFLFTDTEAFYKKKCSCNFVKKETLRRVFSREFWEIFKNTFFIEQLLLTARSFRGIFRSRPKIYDEMLCEIVLKIQIHVLFYKNTIFGWL